PDVGEARDDLAADVGHHFQLLVGPRLHVEPRAAVGRIDLDPVAAGGHAGPRKAERHGFDTDRGAAALVVRPGERLAVPAQDLPDARVPRAVLERDVAVHALPPAAADAVVRRCLALPRGRAAAERTARG